jgi:hypothetical protein
MRPPNLYSFRYGAASLLHRASCSYRAILGSIHNEGLFGQVKFVDIIEHLTDILVVVDLGVVNGDSQHPD